MIEVSAVLTPLPWQNEQWSLLVEQKLQQRLPHALLLHGAAGVGKNYLAHLLAKFLLCENGKHDLPCGKCHSCNLFAAGSHPDFFLASNLFGINEQDGEEGVGRKKKKATAPSKQIKIECIRALVKFSRLSAFQHGKRVAIIEPAEWMNHNSANTLLKTLEEPGEDVFIILVSHQPSRLLPTLRSRCQSHFCATPDHAISMQWLAHHISPERAEMALAFSHAAPLKALSAVNSDQDLLYSEIMLTLEACRRREVTYLFAADSLAKHDAATVLDWWMSLLHRQACEYPSSYKLRFSDELLQARGKVQGTANPNTRMLFESLLIDWMRISD